MTAISKAFVTIADTAVDPASPLDTVLMTGLRDNHIFLKEWLGASYFANAVQDHNHDGLNSAPIAGSVAQILPWPGLVLPSGGGGTWDWCDGNTLLRANFGALLAILLAQATVTISIASPGVVTWPSHGLRSNMPIRFFTTGALPTGITAGTHGGPGAGTEYFVKVVDANTFQFAATPGGTSINTSGTQSGVHTGVVAPHGDGDGATTFHKPDYRGRALFGRDDMGGAAANRLTSAVSGILANVPGRAGGDQNSQAHAHPFTWQQNNGAAGNTDLETANAISGQDTAIGLSPAGTSHTAGPGPFSSPVSGSGGAQNVPPAVICDWIIKTS